MKNAKTKPSILRCYQSIGEFVFAFFIACDVILYWTTYHTHERGVLLISQYDIPSGIWLGNVSATIWAHGCKHLSNALSRVTHNVLTWCFALFFTLYTLLCQCRWGLEHLILLFRKQLASLCTFSIMKQSWKFCITVHLCDESAARKSLE